MNNSEALACVARLQQAFPRGAENLDLADLIAHELLRYEFARAEGAINWLVDERKEPWFPTWGEVHEALRYFTPKTTWRQIETPTVPPPPEFYEAKDRMEHSIRARQRVLHKPVERGPRASARRVGDTIVLTNTLGMVVWDYRPTGTPVDQTELAHAARQWNVPLATLERLARV